MRYGCGIDKSGAEHVRGVLLGGGGGRDSGGYVLMQVGGGNYLQGRKYTHAIAPVCLKGKRA